jgi:hypothetical protein
MSLSSEAHFSQRDNYRRPLVPWFWAHICLSKPPCSIQSQFCCFIEMMQLAVGVITPNPLKVEKNRARRNMTALP